jgi:hypothetical protein
MYAPDDGMMTTNLTTKPVDWEKAFQVSYDLYVDITSTISVGISVNMTRLNEAFGDITQAWYNSTVATSLNGYASQLNRCLI